MPSSDPFASAARGTFPADAGLIVGTGDPGAVGARRVLVTPAGGLYVRNADNTDWIEVLPSSDGPGGGGGGGGDTVITLAGGATAGLVSLAAPDVVPADGSVSLTLDTVQLDGGGDYLTPDPDNDAIIVELPGMYLVQIATTYNAPASDAGVRLTLDTDPSAWSTVQKDDACPAWACGAQIVLNTAGAVAVGASEVPYSIGAQLIHENGTDPGSAGGSILIVSRLGAVVEA